MENHLSFVDTEINHFSRSEKDSEDLYGETMEIFAKEAKEEFDTLKVLFIYENDGLSIFFSGRSHRNGETLFRFVRVLCV